jgi:hypothetical protein
MKLPHISTTTTTTTATKKKRLIKQIGRLTAYKQIQQMKKPTSKQSRPSEEINK